MKCSRFNKEQYGCLAVSDARRLKMLEDENTRPKKLVAQAVLDNASLEDVAAKMVTPDAKRVGCSYLPGAWGEPAARV